MCENICVMVKITLNKKICFLLFQYDFRNYDTEIYTKQLISL